MAQLVRAPPCHGGGQGFEPPSGRSTSYFCLTGVLAQLGEHLPYKQRVIGSSPIGPILFCRGVYTYSFNIRSVKCHTKASSPASHGPLLSINADVAQLAEQLICNQQVNGSSPLIGFMDGFPSGQRGQTVNLLQFASVVRIHRHPFFYCNNAINFIMTRGGAVWKLVGLITRRSQVQILSPLF